MKAEPPAVEERTPGDRYSSRREMNRKTGGAYDVKDQYSGSCFIFLTGIATPCL